MNQWGVDCWALTVWQCVELNISGAVALWLCVELCNSGAVALW